MTQSTDSSRALRKRHARGCTRGAVCTFISVIVARLNVCWCVNFHSPPALAELLEYLLAKAPKSVAGPKAKAKHQDNSHTEGGGQEV